MKKAVNFGIDLGTTNSMIAKYDKGKVLVFKNPIGHSESLPSVVAFRKDRKLVGEKAREWMNKDPLNVFGSFKRKMGTDERYYVVNLDENITPIELSTSVLNELKTFVHTGETPEAVVVTIPASFDSMQSNATMKAGLAAGFSEVFLLQEPIAASLAYFNQEDKNVEDGNWLVYDLGGGTFDVAIVSINGGDLKIIDHEGNNFLGGVDFDHLMVEQFILPALIEKTGDAKLEDELFQKHGKFEKLYYQLLFKAEEAKKELSQLQQTSIDIAFEWEDDEIDFVLDIQRSDFDALVKSKIDATIGMMELMLQRNQLTFSSIQQIVLVGGSTFSPIVRETLVAKTGVFVNTEIDPTSAVAVGSAFYAANKYFEVSEVMESESIDFAQNLLNDLAEDTVESSLQVNLVYPKTSKETEELLLVKIDGVIQQESYRIVRTDGGFDSGIIPLKAKFTEFLALLENTINTFTISLYDARMQELKSLRQTLEITHGKFNISGQPLPKDICIEVDDKENNTTKLQVVFEKNALLPLKKTLYREVSKSIKMGTDERIIINILEGDKNARPLSNLIIGSIEIGGKDLTNDLIKGSDVEIEITVTESRTLKTEIFISMTNQTYSNVFEISEKHIDVVLLREQYFSLESDLKNMLFSLQSGQDILEFECAELLKSLHEFSADIQKLNSKDRSDRKYIVAEQIKAISQRYDKLGGNELLKNMLEYYLSVKSEMDHAYQKVDVDKFEVEAKYTQISQKEPTIIHAKSISFIQKSIDEIREFLFVLNLHNYSYLVFQANILITLPTSEYASSRELPTIFKNIEKAIEQEKSSDLKNLVYSLLYKLKNESKAPSSSDNFKGTGIG